MPDPPPWARALSAFAASARPSCFGTARRLLSPCVRALAAPPRLPGLLATSEHAAELPRTHTLAFLKYQCPSNIRTTYSPDSICMQQISMSSSIRTTYNALVVYVIHTATIELTLKTFCLALPRSAKCRESGCRMQIQIKKQKKLVPRCEVSRERMPCRTEPSRDSPCSVPSRDGAGDAIFAGRSSPLM